jgi:hypothetical protein
MCLSTPNLSVIWRHNPSSWAMAVAELCLNEGKKWLGTEYGIDFCYAGCVKSDKWVIKWRRESLPT